jgi:LmbE family N-acetylglucosaminyl deacetylase
VFTVKNTVFKFVQGILGEERTIKFVEYVRGLYRYPNRMVGRILPEYPNNTSGVLVFAAHPDDDVLGLSATINRHQMNGDRVTVIYVTNGSGDLGESYRLRSSYSKERSALRYSEGTRSLSLLGMKKENVYCLGFPDGGTHRYLKHMATDIFSLIRKFNPKKIYVHSIEGGHTDHDMVSYVVKSVCKKIGFKHLFEWAEYNPTQFLGTEDIKFLSDHGGEMKVELSDKEQCLKKAMLAFHKSQNVEQYFKMGEAIRPADLSDIEKELYEYAKLSTEKLRSIIQTFSVSMNDVPSKETTELKTRWSVSKVIDVVKLKKKGDYL